MVDPDSVGDEALRQRYDGPTYDGSIEQSRALSGQRPQALDTQGKDRWEHDGIEEAHQQDAAHGEIAVG